MNLSPTTPSELLCYLLGFLSGGEPGRRELPDIKYASTLVFDYQRKFGPPDPQPPSNRVISQLMVIAGGRLPELLLQLEREQTPAGKEYSWYVIQALETIYGFKLRPALRANKALLPDVF